MKQGKVSLTIEVLDSKGWMYMIQYVFIVLRRGGHRSLLTSGIFLLAACALILLSATTQTTVLQAHQIISKNWRSTYDLVVLPPKTVVPSGQPVPADQFEGYSGGISIQQYEQIKSLPGIAVAAPIAFISYVRYPTTVVLVGPNHLSPGFYQMNWTQFSFDGRQQIIDAQDEQRVYVLNCSSVSSGVPLIDERTEDALRRLGVDDVQCSQDGKYLAGIPDVSEFLLAAIDPESEDQLLNLNKSITSGRMLTSQDTLRANADTGGITSANGQPVSGYGVPLLVNTQLPEQSHTHASFTRLLTPFTNPNDALAAGGPDYLQHVSGQTLFSGEIPLAQNNPQFFSGSAYQDWDGQTWSNDPLGRRTSFFFTFTSLPSGLTYQSISAPSGASLPAYTLVPRGVYTPPGSNQSAVAFRDLTSLPGTSSDVGGTLDQSIYNGKVYSADIVGEYDGNRVAAAFDNSLDWLPEETYQTQPLVLSYDAQGHPVKPVTLLPTANSAGVSLSPPLALTTLDAARQIVGDKLISVIRVRVAGTVSADEAGWQRVSRIAQLIEQRTGLRAVVTLGSSPQPTLVYIPGLKKGIYGIDQTIEPLGWIEERWIAIGVGLVYLKESQTTQQLLVGSVLLVCLGYLIVTLSSLVTAQRKEFAVLSAVGWEPWQATGLFVTQALVLATGGGAVGIGLALFLVAQIGASPAWFVVQWTLPAILGLALLSALYPLWQIWHIQPAEILRSGTTVSFKSESRGRAWLDARIPALGSMTVYNLIRARIRTFITLGSLFLSAILLTVMVDGILAFRQTLEGTLLGNYVLLQTTVPQVVGVAFTILLTFLCVADLLLLQVRERRKEIGLLQAVGWRPRLVEQLFVQEGMALALMGTLPGVLVALAILLAEHQLQNGVPVPLIGIATVLFMLLVSALATIPAIQASRRIPLMDILRAE